MGIRLDRRPGSLLVLGEGWRFRFLGGGSVELLEAAERVLR